MQLRATHRTAPIFLMLLFMLSVSNSRAGDRLKPTVELEEAAVLANAFLPTLDRNPKELKLVKAENLVFRGPNLLGHSIWRFTYMERSLIPKDGQTPFGAGGQIPIEVDLDKQKAKFLGVSE